MRDYLITITTVTLAAWLLQSGAPSYCTEAAVSQAAGAKPIGAYMAMAR